MKHQQTNKQQTTKAVNKDGRRVEQTQASRSRTKRLKYERRRMEGIKDQTINGPRIRGENEKKQVAE